MRGWTTETGKVALRRFHGDTRTYLVIFSLGYFSPQKPGNRYSIFCVASWLRRPSGFVMNLTAFAVCPSQCFPITMSEVLLLSKPVDHGADETLGVGRVGLHVL